MKQPSIELVLEVNLFEHLEQMTEATVGMLTQLRIKSREERINLLFIAYKERVVNAVIAQKNRSRLGDQHLTSTMEYRCSVGLDLTAQLFFIEF